MTISENKINEFKIKLGGVACLPKDLELEKDFDITIKNAETVSSKLIPNHDGTADKIISLKITERSVITILAENEIIQAKKKGSQSQKLRMVLRELFDQQYSGQYDEFETFYKYTMAGMIKEIENRLL